MNLDNEIKERRKRNQAMRDFLQKKFPNAISAYHQTNLAGQSKAVGKFLRVVKSSDLDGTWDIRRFVPTSWENTNEELKRLFEILNYGDSIEELERLVKSLKSIIKQGKKKGTANVDMMDLCIYFGDIEISEPKWWFAVLEQTFFEE